MQTKMTTGRLRELLAKAAEDVVNGCLEIERAESLQKLAKNVTDSLYSETKIAMFRKDCSLPDYALGSLPVGEVDKT